MPRWGKIAAGVQRKLDLRPGPWIRALGRGLSAAETDAVHRVCWPCPAYMLAREQSRAGRDHPLWGWWEGPIGEFSRRPLLDEVWDLAVQKEAKRRKAEKL